MSPTILVDAGACPNPVKIVLFRAAQTRQFATESVANQVVAVPPPKTKRTVLVSSGFDRADGYIVSQPQSNCRRYFAGGESHSTARFCAQSTRRDESYYDIGEMLAMRDCMEPMRDKCANGRCGGHECQGCAEFCQRLGWFSGRTANITGWVLRFSLL